MRGVGVAFLGLVLLVAFGVLHISFGAKPLPFATILDALWAFDETNFTHHIVVSGRLPRLIVAFACGASLALAGLKAQKLFCNPLVSSSTLGVNSGAVLVSICGVYFFKANEAFIFPWAFGGAAMAGVLTLGLAKAMRASRVAQGLHIVLAGSLVGMLCSSFSVFVMSLDPLQFVQMQSWLLGDIGPSDFKALQLVYPFLGLGVLLLLSQAKSLDAMSLGDAYAQSLGVNVKRVRQVVLGGIFILSAGVVSVVGPIGFVGLVVPHIVKLFVSPVGNGASWGVLVFGGLLLVMADLVARWIIAPKVLLVGAVSASVGGMIFVVLLSWFATKKFK